MNINDFFDPVALPKPDEHLFPDENSLSSSIMINTQNNPIKDLQNFRVAIIGVPEDRNSFNSGSSAAPDAIREKLYQLSGCRNGKTIIDLGNLKRGNTSNDTYFGLSESLKILKEYGIVSIIIGGTQDLSTASVMAYQDIKDDLIYLSIDSRIDLKENINSINSSNYLGKFLTSDGDLGIAKFINLGYQIYLNNQEVIESLRLKFFDCYRLGFIRNNIQECEPIIRDANIVSLDISAIKQGDAPGHYNPSPNGLMSDEACQLSRYAGISDDTKVFGLYEVNPSYDQNNQTSHLAAQIIWYFIDGFSYRYNENPRENSATFKKFIVEIDRTDEKIIFYKSQVSNRWWMEVTNESEDKSKKKIISCSVNDYELACKSEIPDRWLREIHRLG